MILLASLDNARRQKRIKQIFCTTGFLVSLTTICLLSYAYGLDSFKHNSNPKRKRKRKIKISKKQKQNSKVMQEAEIRFL
jgi:hypothetical protein